MIRAVPGVSSSVLLSLSTRTVRNLADQTVGLEAGRNLLLGANGAGKTSWLEGLYLAATSRSFRTSQLADCAAHGQTGFHVALDGAGPQGQRLELGWQPGERRRRLDGRDASLVEYLGVQPVVIYSAAERELVVGPPEVGRRMMDRGVVSCRPGTLVALGRYRRALGQKRSLLAAGERAGLAAWNAVMAEAGAEIVQARGAYVRQVARGLSSALERSGLDLPRPDLLYSPSPAAAADGPEALAAALGAAAASEVERRRPLLGPHRDRLAFRWRGRRLARVASAGETKAISLLLVAAQGEVLAAAGRPPLLLLDDVDAELDPGRLAKVWAAFDGGRNLLATSSRPEVWEGLPREQTWRMEAGELRLQPSRP